jgi:DNA-binding transcriptional regulator LsrR (DeoR family)
MLDGFPNESIAEITEVARIKIERMLRKKYSKNLVEFRVYHRSKFPYLVTAKLKDGSYIMLALQ